MTAANTGKVGGGGLASLPALASCRKSFDTICVKNIIFIFHN